MNEDLAREDVEDLVLEGQPKQQSTSPVANDFFDLPRQKRDSTVSLSENDANSPRGVTTVADAPVAPLDFDENKECSEDGFTPLQYPVQKRSLSNGDEFLTKKESDKAEEEKLAVTASDPDSSGQQSTNSNEPKRPSRPSDDTKSNTDESKSLGSGGNGSGQVNRAELAAAVVKNDFASDIEGKPRNKTFTNEGQMSDQKRMLRKEESKKKQSKSPI